MEGLEDIRVVWEPGPQSFAGSEIAETYDIVRVHHQLEVTWLEF
jgi:hypothetical protein